MRTITHIVVHHTGSDSSTVERIRRVHKAKGWSDIGYHAVIYADGSVHDGRAKGVPGAHVRGFNRSTLAAAMVGDLNRHPPTEAQLKAAIWLCASWARKAGIDAGKVVGHRETKGLVPRAMATKKSCPGTCVDMYLFRSGVTEQLRVIGGGGLG